MTKLFRQLGWPETPESDEHHRTFQCTNGVVIALYAASHYEREFGSVMPGFKGKGYIDNYAGTRCCVYELPFDVGSSLRGFRR
jgi:hypothetical protein